MAVERLTKEHWVKKLGLTPHPEGGYFAQTFKSKTMITIPGKIEKPHSTGTDIYYLMGNPSKGEFSSWHKLHNIEESWHHQYGSDVIIYMLNENGNFSEHRLGLGENATLQVHVPANVWFCATVDSKSPDDYALVGCTCQPGFEFDDFELADRTKLTQQFPQHKNIIEKYTLIASEKEKIKKFF